MPLKRVIPCLLPSHSGLVKTVTFKNPTYVGDPINAVKTFNEKQVDELIFPDIDATVHLSRCRKFRRSYTGTQCGRFSCLRRKPFYLLREAQGSAHQLSSQI